MSGRKGRKYHASERNELPRQSARAQACVGIRLSLFSCLAALRSTITHPSLKLRHKTTYVSQSRSFPLSLPLPFSLHLALLNNIQPTQAATTRQPFTLSSISFKSFILFKHNNDTVNLVEFALVLFLFALPVYHFCFLLSTALQPKCHAHDYLVNR